MPSIGFSNICQMASRKVMTKEMNPYVWFGDREVSPIPRHFIRAPSPLTSEAKEWVLISLKGRFGCGEIDDTTDLVNSSMDWKTVIFFEDSAEAMMYELRWSGNN